MRRAACMALALALAAPLAQAWVGEQPDTHHATLALLAAERLPEPHRSFLLEHEEAFTRGAWEPDATVHTFYHAYEPHDRGGGALHEVERAAYDATMAIRNGAPDEEVAYRMGYITHFVLDLSVPFHTGQDLYDHGWHLAYERSAQIFHEEIPLPPPREPREVEDPRAAALALARRSAEAAGPLLASLDQDQVPWTPDARNLTGEMVSLGLETTADLLLTAFLRADPSRPDPPATHADDFPLPHDAEDVGLGRGDIRHWMPWEGAFLLGAATMAIILGVLGYLTGRRRRERRGGPRAE